MATCSSLSCNALWEQGTRKNWDCRVVASPHTASSQVHTHIHMNLMRRARPFGPMRHVTPGLFARPSVGCTEASCSYSRMRCSSNFSLVYNAHIPP